MIRRCDEGVEERRTCLRESSRVEMESSRVSSWDWSCWTVAWDLGNGLDFTRLSLVTRYEGTLD